MNNTIISKQKGIPLYYQLETILRRRIMGGEYTFGSPLPPEENIQNEFGVSRITVRQALRRLEEDQLIIRRAGKGTFITEKQIDLEPIKLVGNLDDVVLLGSNLVTKTIGYSLIKANKNITDILGLPEGRKVYKIERIRFTKEEPFSYILTYLPQTIGKRIQLEALKTKPVMKHLEEDLGIQLKEAAQVIEADEADSYIADLLHCRIGQALLKVERTLYDVNHKPVEYVTIVYKGNMYSYNVKLVRKSDSKLWKWGMK